MMCSSALLKLPFTYREITAFRCCTSRISAFGQYRSFSVQKESPKVITNDEYFRKCEDFVHKYTKHVDEAVGRWQKNDEIYFGKERDFKNFPIVKIEKLHPKVRLGFIPHAWFEAFYEKTGVTGPYLFLFGTSFFMISKELILLDPHLLHIVYWAVLITIITKYYGARIGKFIDRKVDENFEKNYMQPIAALRENLNRTITTADTEISRASLVPSLVKAKEESVDLQLEVAYRERIQHAYRTVNRYLSYHAERESTSKRILQQHLVQWVVNQVVSGITPAQEKETLNHCIGELKRLAQLNKPTAVA